MKRSLFALPALALAAGLSGCNTPVDPSVQAAFTTMCAYLPALGPVVGELNGQIQADYADAKAICALGTPTSAVVLGLDILTVYNALEPYFVKSVPQSRPAMARIDAGLKAHGLK